MTGFSPAILLIKYINLLTSISKEIYLTTLNIFLRFVVEYIYFIELTQAFV